MAEFEFPKGGKIKLMTAQIFQVKVFVAEGHLVGKKEKVSAIMALCFSSNGVSHVNLFGVASYN